MMKDNSKDAFTLVEMMVAMLLGAILALSIGIMLVFSYKAWGNDASQVRAQSDTAVAMAAIEQQIRLSSINDIKIDGVTFIHNDYAAGTRLDFSANQVRTNNVAIYKDGDRLISQPGDIVLVESGVDDFTVQFNPEGPRVEIRLIVRSTQGQERTTFRSTIFPRN